MVPSPKITRILFVGVFIVVLFLGGYYLFPKIFDLNNPNEGGQTTTETTTTTSILEPYIDISVEVAHDMIVNTTQYPNLLILDVRTQGEFDSGHIENAILIPYNELAHRLSEIRAHQYSEIIIYCGSGSRSLIAASTLVECGFTKVFNMLGGFTAWLAAGYQPL